MSSIKVTPNVSGTGIFTIAAPNSNNNRTMTLADSNGTIYIAPGDGIQALASGVPAARTITAGTGVSVANGDGVAGNPTITNSGVTSVTASTGISASASTGGVTLTNTGVTSIVAGTNITISGSTGAVTVNAASSAPTTAQVLSATAGATTGDIGTYAFLGDISNVTTAPGSTRAGSNLRYAGVGRSGGGWNGTTGVPVYASGTTTTPSGTWRAMGNSLFFGFGCCQSAYPATLWLRIS